MSAYNCAGFALGTFSWYSPHDEKVDGEYGRYLAENQEEAFAITQRSVRQMLADFEGRLRVIADVAEAHSNETVIAFRIAPYDNDFHFIRRSPLDGKWYEKHGGRPWIEEIDEEIVLSDNWEFSNGSLFFAETINYDGPLVLLALVE